MTTLSQRWDVYFPGVSTTCNKNSNITQISLCINAFDIIFSIRNKHFSFSVHLDVKCYDGQECTLCSTPDQFKKYRNLIWGVSVMETDEVCIFRLLFIALVNPNRNLEIDIQQQSQDLNTCSCRRWKHGNAFQAVPTTSTQLEKFLNQILMVMHTMERKMTAQIFR